MEIILMDQTLLISLDPYAILSSMCPCILLQFQPFPSQVLVVVTTSAGGGGFGGVLSAVFLTIRGTSFHHLSSVNLMAMFSLSLVLFPLRSYQLAVYLCLSAVFLLRHLGLKTSVK
jgi:hypothetical protein